MKAKKTSKEIVASIFFLKSFKMSQINFPNYFIFYFSKASCYSCTSKVSFGIYLTSNQTYLYIQTQNFESHLALSEIRKRCSNVKIFNQPKIKCLNLQHQPIKQSFEDQTSRDHFSQRNVANLAKFKYGE